MYRHQYSDNAICHYPTGKVVCVGRNYAEHAKELNNPVPTEPLYFIKPSTSICASDNECFLPETKGTCHFECELSVLITKTLTKATEVEAQAAIGGVGLGLDLTLRDLQSELKAKGHPWERAKAFDNSCVLTAFEPIRNIPDLTALSFSLKQNGEIKQIGHAKDMIFPIISLITDISNIFTLLPGDVVLTGTPKGVGPLHAMDKLELSLDGLWSVAMRVDHRGKMT